MRSKRKHIYWGLWGIYLLIVTLCMLLSGGYQLINTIQHNIFMGVIGPNRLNYEEFTLYLYIRFALFSLVALIQIAIGCLVGFCFLITPTVKQIKRIAYLFCILAICTITRGIVAGIIGVMTFVDIPQAVVFFIFAKYWGKYQEGLFDSAYNRKYFPFIQEFRKVWNVYARH